MNFITKNPKELIFNPFTTIGTDWMLVTAERDGICNTMTASWGGVGILFGKPVAYIFLRPHRYTKEFVDAASTLSLSVLPEDYRNVLNYLGTVSGREEDKISKTGLTIEHFNETPYFAEANIVMICRKVYAQTLEETSFLDPSLIEKWFPTKDFHTLYIAEIETVLTKEA